MPINLEVPKAQILVVHGLYEHSGLYINVIKYILFKKKKKNIKN